jgi:hypothetical protein
VLVELRIVVGYQVIFYLRRRRARSAKVPDPIMAQDEGSGTGLNVSTPVGLTEKVPSGVAEVVKGLPGSF